MYRLAILNLACVLAYGVFTPDSLLLILTAVGLLALSHNVKKSMTYVNNYYLAASRVTGWPGVIHHIEDCTYRHANEAKRGVESVQGVISLFPSRRHRWLETRELGWVQLDVFFSSYQPALSKELWKLFPRAPLLFWGELRDRIGRTIFPETGTRFELDWYSSDKSHGKVSPLGGTLISSAPKELVILK